MNRTPTDGDRNTPEQQRAGLLDLLGQVIFFAEKLPASDAVNIGALRKWQTRVAYGGPREPILCICDSYGHRGGALPNCPRPDHASAPVPR